MNVLAYLLKVTLLVILFNYINNGANYGITPLIALFPKSMLFPSIIPNKNVPVA